MHPSRVFWILIVVTGFSLAGVLIKEAFNMWDEAPISSDIETLPLTKITLPKVTVCPPRNTYTNLNYDLMMTANMTVDNNTRNELIDFALELIQDETFKNFMSNLSLIEEENRFYNWYYAYTDLTFPNWGYPGRGKYNLNKNLPECQNPTLEFDLDTKATSGTLKTKYFGQTPKKNMLQQDFHADFSVRPPDNYLYNNNITLHFEITKYILDGFDKFFDENEDSYDGENRLFLNFTPPQYTYKFSFQRTVSDKDFENLDINQMSGLRIKWYYSGTDQTAPEMYDDYDYGLGEDYHTFHNQFVRYFHSRTI